jgi:hypothetical protein
VRVGPAQALRVEHGQQIVSAFAIAHFGKPQRDSRRFHDPILGCEPSDAVQSYFVA